MGEIVDPGRTSLGSGCTLNWVGVVSDMLMDVFAVVGDEDGLLNWDFLCLFMFPVLAAEKEDDSLALLFLFHSGVQMTLTLDGDGMLGSSLQEAESSGLTAGMLVVLYSQLLLLLGHGVQPLLHPVHGGGHLQQLLGHPVHA